MSSHVARAKRRASLARQTTLDQILADVHCACACLDTTASAEREDIVTHRVGAQLQPDGATRRSCDRVRATAAWRASLGLASRTGSAAGARAASCAPENRAPAARAARTSAAEPAPWPGCGAAGRGGTSSWPRRQTAAAAHLARSRPSSSQCPRGGTAAHASRAHPRPRPRPRPRARRCATGIWNVIEVVVPLNSRKCVSCAAPDANSPRSPR